MSLKISQLPEATEVLANDLLVVVQDGETKRITKETLLEDVTPPDLSPYFDKSQDTTEDITEGATNKFNVTHTGDVSDDEGVLTLNGVAITGKNQATPSGLDFILFSDTSDSGKLKKALISELPSSGGGGAGMSIGGAVSSGTPGSILIVDSDGNLSQDSNLFWDNASKRLGVGTNNPGDAPLSVSRSGSAADIVRFAGMFDVLRIYADGGSNFHWSGRLAVDQTLFVNGGLALANASSIDWNDSSLSNVGVMTFRPAGSAIKMYHDYNVGTSLPNQGIIMRFDNDTAGATDHAAYQVYSNSDSSDIRFFMSARGWGYLVNKQADKPVWALRAAPGQSASIQEWQDSGGSVLSSISNNGSLALGGNHAPTAKLDINSDTIRLRTPKTPATSGASGNQGDLAWDADYLYGCIAANSWRRIAWSTF